MVLCGVLAIAWAWLPRSVAAATSTIVHLRLDGVVNPVKARYIARGIEQARALQAPFVLVSIDTPGGLVSSMEAITSAITNQPIPVIGFVYPPTAEATSAGAFILLSTDVAAMAPGTRTGAAHPVGNGRALEGPLDAKATNSLVSLAKSLAARHHRSETFAEAIVRDSASYTAEEAKAAGGVDVLAADVPGLLQALDGWHVDAPGKNVTLDTKHLTVVDFPLSASHRFLDRLLDPTLASIFLTLGVLGLLFELKSPGIGVAGLVGAICLVLALVAMAALPLRLGALALIVVGLTGIALEVKVGLQGALAVGGLFAFVLGALVLVDESAYFGATQRVSLRIVAPTAALVAGTFIAFAAIAAKALRAPARSGAEAMVGMRGQARSEFAALGGANAGTVFVDGGRWNAESNELIREGDAVVVVRVLIHPMRLQVRRSEVRKDEEGGG